MTSGGGSKGFGIIFSYDPSSSTYTKLKDFDYANGANPYGSLMQAGDGKLYGMTYFGGSNDVGVIFSFDPSSSTFTKLKDFDYANGATPFGSLMQATDGKLYGMTNAGGSSGLGVIFSYDPSSSTYTKLKDLDNIIGANPQGSLMQASDGKLYGMTVNGGNSSYGVIFSFDPSSSNYKKLKDLDATTGGNPYGSLIQTSDGKLYGMTVNGGSSNGVIFSFDPSASAYTILKDFDGDSGANPYGDLIQANDRKLYGMTKNGGSSGYGVIFSFDPSASAYTKLKDFDNTNGANPQSSFMQASDGKLYGVTFSGGSGGAGVTFSFDPSASTFAKLKDFGSNTTGSDVLASLVQADDEKLYGITFSGGSNGVGVIFSFDPSSSTYAKLKDFDNTNGGNPTGSLIQASDGKLYGMTSMGGSNGVGVIFSFDPSASTYTKLKDFDNINGATPHGSFVQAGDGKLYGMTYRGGSSDAGVIFSFDPSTSTYTKLKDFDYPTGAGAYGSLMQVSDGKLYGMTSIGGSSDVGVIFSFNPSSSAYTKLKDFDGINGASPRGNLIQASDGKLYGTTSVGGSSDVGVIFRFDPSSSTYTKLKDFNDSDGESPFGNLMQASDGKVYGVTSGGGISGYGVIFSFDLSSSAYTKLKDYTGANGAYPGIGSAFIEVKDNQDKTPVVNLSIPYNIVKYSASARIKLNATATDEDGKIIKVQFFNGTTRIHTETEFPYGFLWVDVPAGNYTFTAKAFDNSGNVTTSNFINVSVVEENVPPVVSIVSPVDDTTYTGPANIRLIAKAKDPNDKLSKVEFYSGSALLRTEHYYPYTYWWTNVQPGTYTITAVAYEDKGLSTTSAAITVTVTNTSIVSRPSSVTNKTNLNGALNLQLSPNPAKNTLQIYTKGLQLNKPSTISVISASGVIMRTMHLNLKTVVQLDVSSMVSGVYTIKVVSGDKVMYKQFVKL